MDEFQIVSQSEVHKIIAPYVAQILDQDGFVPIGLLKWVRSRNAPIRQIFCFSAWKGGVIAPTWGLSLDFVPHLSGTALKWHRTDKSARLDLTIDSRDRNLDIDYSKGSEEISTKAPMVVHTAAERARKFWSSYQIESDLLAAFQYVRSHLSTGGLGFYNYTQHSIALAFVYARAGLIPEANTELEKFIKAHHLNDMQSDRIRQLLAATRRD